MTDSARDIGATNAHLWIDIATSGVDSVTMAKAFNCAMDNACHTLEDSGRHGEWPEAEDEIIAIFAANGYTKEY